MFSRHNNFLFTLIAGIFIISVRADGINITGTIKDSLTSKGISGAAVSLVAFPSITATTNDSGNYTLNGTATGVKGLSMVHGIGSPFLKNNYLYFGTGSDIAVQIALYTLSGGLVKILMNKQLTPGDYRIDLPNTRLSDQFYFARIKIGATTYMLKYAQVNTRAIARKGGEGPDNAGAQKSGLAKNLAINDTIIISATGHKAIHWPITAYSGNVSVSLLANRLQGLAHVTAVSPIGISGAGLSKKASTPFTPPFLTSGFINAGAPDYLTVTLKQIVLRNTDSIVPAGQPILTVVAWEGSKTLNLTGAGKVDVGDIILDNFPTWKITEIDLSFNDSALIKGALNADFNMDTTYTQFLTESKTFYTKAAYAYDAAVNTGGADNSVGRSAAFETAPAESSFIRLQGSTSGVASVVTPSNYTYDTAGPLPSLTLVFDLSRMLRFYNGCNVQHTGGVNPLDPAGKAYFFCHTVFYGSVAAFFGTPGQIQGYASAFNCKAGNCGVLGWMTIVCNSAGDIISGIIMGNNDNDLVISKGNITTVTGANPYNFHYSGSDVDITGFTKGIAIKDSSIVTYAQFNDAGDTVRTGQAKFTLGFQTN